jgi:hypothetical protein
MTTRSTRELGRALPDRLRLLSRLITRKPASYTSQYARSIDESFHLYTNTRTVNATLALSSLLMQLDWPFPAYLDMEREFRKSARELNALRKLKWLAVPYLLVRPSLGAISIASIVADKDEGAPPKAVLDAAIVNIFRRNHDSILDYLAGSPVLRSRQPIVRDIQQTYRRKLWAATITTTVPLLDFAMRDYFGTTNLYVTVQVLRDAFIRIAKIHPKGLMPGSAVWDGQQDPTKGNAFAQTLEEDLRLPGVYLASFLEFADRYYEWYTTTDTRPRSSLKSAWNHALRVRLLERGKRRAYHHVYGSSCPPRKAIENIDSRRSSNRRRPALGHLTLACS